MLASKKNYLNNNHHDETQDKIEVALYVTLDTIMETRCDGEIFYFKLNLMHLNIVVTNTISNYITKVCIM